MAAQKEFYLKAVITAQDKVTPALNNTAKQAEIVKKLLWSAFNDRLYTGGNYILARFLSGRLKISD